MTAVLNKATQRLSLPPSLTSPTSSKEKKKKEDENKNCTNNLLHLIYASPQIG